MALTVASIVVFYVKGPALPRAAAGARSGPTTPAAPASTPTPTATPSAARASSTPASTTSARPTATPTPSPTPDGPPFVLDAAPSCAGSTALIDLQVAATSKRPIMRIELLLDGVAALLTPVPTYPMLQYAGRSSGQAASAGSGTWILRAIDGKGIVESKPYPYACG